MPQVCQKDSKTLLKGVVDSFKLICQIRNTDGKLHKKIAEAKRKDFENKENGIEAESEYAKIPEREKFDEDFILSPVEPFFDSRTPENFGENLPENGDDNGAYNIARKGQILLQRIAEWEKIPEENRVGKKKFPELFVSNQEWDKFVQNNQQ